MQTRFVEVNAVILKNTFSFKNLVFKDKIRFQQDILEFI